VITSDVLRATDFVVAAIEIVDSRIRDWRISIVDTVADNASSGMLVLGGSPGSLCDINDVRSCDMTLTCESDVVSSGTGAARQDGTPRVSSTRVRRASGAWTPEQVKRRIHRTGCHSTAPRSTHRIDTSLLQRVHAGAHRTAGAAVKAHRPPPPGCRGSSKQRRAGRAKDRVKVGGENMSAAEAVVMSPAEVPEVADVASRTTC
jgi:hypothetical protein